MHYHAHDGHVHDHEHDGDHEHGAHDHRAVWLHDNIELRTVGIDIGSSTSHFMFARVHLQRDASRGGTRFEVVEREVLWRSPIRLTPYLDDYTIDTARLAAFLDEGYRDAGFGWDEVDSGAVILTGEALKRHNASAIADLFSRAAGRFVCAAAGHHMEAVLGAHGSGAVELSAERNATVLNVDIGGGTTKLSVSRNGRIAGVTVVAIGARLLVVDEADRIVRLEPPLLELARDAGIALALGERLAPEARTRLVARMADVLLELIDRRPGTLAQRLQLTQPWPDDVADLAIDALTFSGGVAEYLYDREPAEFGDLGRDLATELRGRLASRPVWDPGQGIRATVIGASQFSVQVSGATIAVAESARLPLRNVPVISARVPDDASVDVAAFSAAIRRSLVQSDLTDGEGPLALGLAFAGVPTHARLAAVARGVAAALPRTLGAPQPLVLLIDSDVGMSLGRILQREIAPGSTVIALDGVRPADFEFVDVGYPLESAAVVPITIKSFVFSRGRVEVSA